MSKQINREQQYELVGREVMIWLSSARQLKQGADLVRIELDKTLAIYPRGRASYEDLALFKPYLFLSGLALENLVKGIHIGRSPSIIAQGKFDTGQVAGSRRDGHLTLEMVQVIVPNLSRDEEELIERLRQFILWMGRYPISKRASDLDEPSFKTTDPALIDKIFEDFCRILEEENGVRQKKS